MYCGTGWTRTTMTGFSVQRIDHLCYRPIFDYQHVKELKNKKTRTLWVRVSFLRLLCVNLKHPNLRIREDTNSDRIEWHVSRFVYLRVSLCLVLNMIQRYKSLLICQIFFSFLFFNNQLAPTTNPSFHFTITSSHLILSGNWVYRAAQT